ncbi:glutathione S-transferase Mu 3-like [Paramacrobiotus metropolitanus]|uniref:glutathione S-transferase Mu 3-like n=1 Tax=Paramacrobiotus metropolitanus TaxID=2943436 RepID=UPI00244644EE|nr:glutathione S-transferase Mu 3-like [Paramacrobiotus metropolitanus]
MASTPVLAYWDIRGLANPIRMLLEHVGVKYEFKVWDHEPETGWFAQKDKLDIKFPNLPYYIEGDKKFSQSGAIIKYLARKHGLVAKNEDDLIQQDIVDGLLQDFRNLWSWLVYVSSNDLETDKPRYHARVDPVMKQLDEMLDKQKFLVGDYLTYNDFIFFEILDINTKLFPDFLQQFPNLQKYHDRIQHLKGVQEYLQSDRNPKKINGFVAKWGG